MELVSLRAEPLSALFFISSRGEKRSEKEKQAKVELTQLCPLTRCWRRYRTLAHAEWLIYSFRRDTVLIRNKLTFLNCEFKRKISFPAGFIDSISREFWRASYARAIASDNRSVRRSVSDHGEIGLWRDAFATTCYCKWPLFYRFLALGDSLSFWWIVINKSSK